MSKLRNGLIFLVLLATFTFSVYGLVAKRYQKTVLKETPVEESSLGADKKVESSGSGSTETAGVLGVAETAPAPASSPQTLAAPTLPLIESDTPKETNLKETEPSTPQRIAVSIAIDYGGGRVEEAKVEVNEKTSVYDCLKSMAQVEAKTYSYGVFVEGINGVRSNPATGQYWLYAVNGKNPPVGADQYFLSQGDSLRWIYTRT